MPVEEKNEMFISARIRAHALSPLFPAVHYRIIIIDPRFDDSTTTIDRNAPVHVDGKSIDRKGVMFNCNVIIFH